MSHYLEGKLKIKCSIDLLRRALINVMPSWDKHVRVDPNGLLTIYGYGGVEVKNKTFHILVPGPRNPNYTSAPNNVYGDLGLRRETDGSWSVLGDRAGMRVAELEEQLKGELLRMKARAWAKIRGADIVGEVNNENEVYTDISIDSSDAARLVGQAY